MSHNGVMVKLPTTNGDIWINALNVTAIEPRSGGVRCAVHLVGGKEFVIVRNAEAVANEVANALVVGKIGGPTV